jgi:UPF0176 protein
VKYLNEVSENGKGSFWKGKNFSFDALLSGEKLIDEEIISNCHQCGNPSGTILFI